MTKKYIVLILSVIILIVCCASNRPPITKHKVESLREKSLQAIDNCRIFDEKNTERFKAIIHQNGEDNVCSDALLEILWKRGYVEADIRKTFNHDIARIFLDEIFEEEYDPFSVHYITVSRGGIKFSLEYLSGHMQLPNIVSFVYVFEEDNPEDMRMFYKVNYGFGYYDEEDLTDERKILAFY